MPDIQLRLLSTEELSQVNQIDVSEAGRIVYKYHRGALLKEKEEWERPRRSEATWLRYTRAWEEMIERGGAAIGAFAGDSLVGIAVVRYNLTADMAQLAGLFVDKEHRRSGAATLLVEEAVRLARQSGASRLYVSATPSESAVGFYQSRGFHLAEQVHPELYALEPEDIHMVMEL